MPKVSVLMPIYNTKEEYLRETIQSILNQTFRDFEYIILNNSPSNTDLDKIVASYQDDRIRYFRSDYEMGISKGRNKLIDLAQGEYLAIMDHDDMALPERFAEEVKILDEHPEIGVVSCAYETFPKKKIFVFPETNEEIQLYLTSDCYILHPASMIRKSILLQNNIRYEEEYSPSEDYALFGMLIGKTEFYNIPKILFHYRLHENNTSKIQSDKMTVNAQKVRDFIRQDHPELWKDFENTAPHVVRMKLFGLIPFGKFVQQGSSRRGILKYLPFLSVKIKPYFKKG